MKIEKGYYIKARKVQESEIAHAPPHVREIWDWLIMEANHQDKKSSGKMIKRGQLVRSYNDIREGLYWMVGWRKQRYSKNDCETSMRWLTKRLMVHTTKTTRGLLITIDKYCTYQDPSNYEADKETYKKHTRSIQSTDTINKNVKNEKNVRIKETTTSNDKVVAGIPPIFKIFERVNPAIKRMYGNKAQRDAIDRLIKEFGKDNVTKGAEAAVACLGRAYAPRITTPYQLETKWGSLVAYYQESKEKKLDGMPKILKIR